MTTDNYRKHTTKSRLQRFFIERFFATLLAEIRARNPVSILDVGCGEGFTLGRLRRAGMGELLEGVDYSERAVELGKRVHPTLNLKRGDIYSLPYPDGAFDTVLCCEVLEHLERPEDAMQELKRVTSRWCILSVPREPIFRLANFLRGKNLSRWGNDIEHIQHWSTRGILRLAGKHFAVRTVRTSFPWTILVCEKR